MSTQILNLTRPTAFELAIDLGDTRLRRTTIPTPSRSKKLSTFGRTCDLVDRFIMHGFNSPLRTEPKREVDMRNLLLTALSLMFLAGVMLATGGCAGDVEPVKSKSFSAGGVDGE